MNGVFIEGMEEPRSCSECYIREKNSCPLLKTYVSDWGKPLNCPIRRFKNDLSSLKGEDDGRT